MKRLANISLVSLALIALFAGAALADAPDLYSDDESGYQDQAAAFKALLNDDSVHAFEHTLQHIVDVELGRSFAEVEITPGACTADEKYRFEATLARTDIITDELGFE